MDVAQLMEFLGLVRPVLQVASCLALAVVGWVALLLAVATAVNGRAWVWAQTRASWRDAGWRRSRRCVLGQWIPPRGDEPVAVAPRGGWLQ